MENAIEFNDDCPHCQAIRRMIIEYHLSLTKESLMVLLETLERNQPPKMEKVGLS